MILSDPLTVVFTALIGLAAGSFCNVVIHRVPVGASVVTPLRSECPSCGALVRALHNIPVLSWLILGGRSRCCDTAISWRYPLVEAAVAALFALLGARLVPSELLAVVLPFAAGAVCVTVIDLAHYRIPHTLTATLAVLAAAGAAVVALTVDEPPAGGGFDALWVPAACGLAVSASLYLLHAAVPRGMGRGDVNLGFAVGVVAAAAAGAGAVWVAVSVAVVSAAVAGLATVSVRAVRSRGGAADRRVPFGPHLAVGTLVAVLWGAPLWDAYSGLLA